MIRQMGFLTLGAVLIAGAPAANADVLLEGFEGVAPGPGAGGGMISGGSFAISTDHATQGANSLAVQATTAWADVAVQLDFGAAALNDLGPAFDAHQYLAFDVYFTSGGKMSLIGVNGDTQSYTDQQLWQDALTPPTYPHVVIPAYNAGDPNRGPGALQGGTPMTLYWDYPARGIAGPTAEDPAWFQVQFRIQSSEVGPAGTIYLDNFRLVNAVPEPASLSLLGLASLAAVRRRR